MRNAEGFVENLGKIRGWKGKNMGSATVMEGGGLINSKREQEMSERMR